MRVFGILLLLFVSTGIPVAAQRIPFSELTGGFIYSKTVYRNDPPSAGILSIDRGGGVIFEPQISTLEISRRRTHGDSIRFRFGELIGLAIGIGPTNNKADIDPSSDGEGITILDNTWNMAGVNLGAQAAYQLSNDWEIGLKIYQMRIYDSGRRAGQGWDGGDDMFVVKLPVRYRSWLLEPGLRLAGKTARFEYDVYQRDYFQLAARWLSKKKIFLGARYEIIKIRSASRPEAYGPGHVPSLDYLTGQTFRVLLGFRI